MKEEWRDLKGYNGAYEVSNLGRIKCNKFGVGKRGHMIKFQTKNHPTPTASVSKRGKVKVIAVKSLVYNTFNDTDVKTCFIRNIDGDLNNNNLSNLEEVQPSNARARKPRVPPEKFKSIPDDVKADIMKYFWSHDDNRDSTIAKKFGLTSAVVSQFILSELDKHFAKIRDRVNSSGSQ